MIVINGLQKPEAEGITISQYLSSEGFVNKTVAVECNGGIIPKQDYDFKTIMDGEIIEIVSLVGGA